MPDDLATLATTPLSPFPEGADGPLTDATLPRDPADEMARKPTLNLGLSRIDTKPLARLETVYRSMTFPIIRLSRSSVLVRRKTVQLSSPPAEIMQAEMARARRRVQLLGISLIMAGSAMMLITLYLWRHP
ncbi:MAG: hypothetical protein H0X24_09120 [Ktedonobacterales bacterium]|nr:hypothetical protein [Ktedonobacterales bacterium]